MVALVAVMALAITGYVGKSRFASNVVNVRNGIEDLHLELADEGIPENGLYLFYTGSGVFDTISSGSYTGPGHGIDMGNYDVST